MRLPACIVAVWLAAAPVLAQDAVRAAYEAALVESPTPATLRIEQEAWQADWTEYVDERAGMEEMRLDALTRLRARDRALRAQTLPADALATRCVDAGLANCGIDASGSLTLADGSTIYFQQQSGNTEDEGFGTAMIVMAGDPQALRPIFWLGGPIGVMPVKTHRSEGGPDYVVLPAYGQGTGSQWVGTMFRWNGPGRAPTEIDAQSWLITLNDELPPGLGVWKGPAFDWDALTAESSLWQDSDANCCPTGGRMGVEFTVEEDALKASNLWVEDAVLTVAAQVQPEILSWISRRHHCGHWAGEEPYDDARRAEIETAVARLSCATLEADEATLRAANAENAATLALLDRAKINPPSR